MLVIVAWLWSYGIIRANAFITPQNVRISVAEKKQTLPRREFIMRRENHIDEEFSHPIPLSSKYYLLTYDVWKRIISFTSVLLLLKMMFHHYVFSAPLWLRNYMKFWPLVYNCCQRSFILPLLSSSCCVVQLLLNAIASLGCIGFNTILGPLRPIFISILLFTTVTSLSIEKSQVVRMTLSWLIAIMPEIVHYINKSDFRARTNPNEKSNTEGLMETYIKINIENMGCVACINKIDSIVRNTFYGNVPRFYSWLHDSEKAGGTMQIILEGDQSEGEIKSNTKRIVAALRKNGFTCQIEV